MIPVSVSEIRSWHAQHRDEGDWRWCAIDRLLDELDALSDVARRFWDNWIPFDDRTPPVWVTPYEPDEPMTEVERAALDALRARDHVDREESE